MPQTSTPHQPHHDLLLGSQMRSGPDGDVEPDQGRIYSECSIHSGQWNNEYHCPRCSRSMEIYMDYGRCLLRYHHHCSLEIPPHRFSESHTHLDILPLFCIPTPTVNWCLPRGWFYSGNQSTYGNIPHLPTEEHLATMTQFSWVLYSIHSSQSEAEPLYPSWRYHRMTPRYRGLNPVVRSITPPGCQIHRSFLVINCLPGNAISPSPTPQVRQRW